MHRPPRRGTRCRQCNFASLPEMLAAAATQSDGLDMGAVEILLVQNGYNVLGLFNEMVTGGDDSLLCILGELGIGALGQRRAILRVLKFEAII